MSDYSNEEIYQAVMGLVKELDERFAAERQRADQIHAGFARLDHAHPEIGRLIEVLEGKETVMPSGRRIREGGLIAEVARLTPQVKQLTHQLRGGSVKLKLPRSAWVAIVAAIIAGFAQVLSALVG